MRPPLPIPALPPILLAGCLMTGAALADPRFVTVAPGAEPGSWAVEMAGTDGTVALFADGRRVPATVETAADGRVRAILTGLPGNTRFLGAADGAADVPEAAVMLRSTDAPAADLSIYHVFVGHFANGNRSNDTDQMRGYRHVNYIGGDLQGLLKRIDHIASLGVNAVWLSPIFPAESDHGYDVKNYYRIGGTRAVPNDPQASLALYREVRDALHRRGIKLILDVPLNHAHAHYDLRAGDPGGLKPKRTKARQRAEKVWEGWGSPYKYWNMDDADTRRFLKDAALHWLVDEKADGLRLDYVRGVDHAFWAELYREVKAAKPDAILIGEAWADEMKPMDLMRDIGLYYQPVDGIGPQFDTLFDFPFQYAATDVFGRKRSATELETWLQAADAAYGALGRPAYFLDNHDLARLGAWTGDDGRVIAAVGFMAALSGPVSLFYGTETGLTHGSPRHGFTDAGRVAMPWEKLNRDMIGQVGAYMKARATHAVLRRGARLPLLATDDVLVMAKRDGGGVALVGVNLGDSARDVSVDIGTLLPEGTRLTIVAGGGSAPEPAPGSNGRRIVWTLPPVSTQIALPIP